MVKSFISFSQKVRNRLAIDKLVQDSRDQLLLSSDRATGIYFVGHCTDLGKETLLYINLISVFIHVYTLTLTLTACVNNTNINLKCLFCSFLVGQLINIDRLFP